MDKPSWVAVDRYIEESLIGRDAALEAALRANAEAGLPAHDVSPPQGKLLALLARMSGARSILEIGTLGAYSTIWLARALPPGGRVVTLEASAERAAVACANLRRAGVADRVDVRVGPALDSLPNLVGEAPFDLFFIDADKVNNPPYLSWALRLARVGSVVVADNVVRDGAVLDATSADPSVVGVRGTYELLATNPRLDATVLQTVGSKGWDGFALALVVA